MPTASFWCDDAPGCKVSATEEKDAFVSAIPKSDYRLWWLAEIHRAVLDNQITGQ